MSRLGEGAGKTPVSSAAEMAVALQGILAASEMVIEMCAGYKAKCRSAGFGEEAADQMGSDFHRHLSTLIFRGAAKAKS